MAGVPASVRDAAAAKAKALKLDAPFAVTLSRSSVEPFLQYADDRGLARDSCTAPGPRAATMPMPATTAPSSTEMLALRAERAALLGYENFAAFKLADSMAGTPAKARALLEEVWDAGAPARAGGTRCAAGADRARRRQLPRWRPGTGAITPKSCGSEKYDFDEAAAEALFPACPT